MNFLYVFISKIQKDESDQDKVKTITEMEKKLVTIEAEARSFKEKCEETRSEKESEIDQLKLELSKQSE